MPPRTKAVQDSISALRGVRDSFSARHGEIFADERFADEYRQKLLSEARSEHATSGKAKAKAAWNGVNRALDEAGKAYRDAHAKHQASIDPARRLLAIESLRAELSGLPSGPDPFSTSTVVDVVRQRHAALRRAGDTDGLAALRTVAAPLLNDAATQGVRAGGGSGSIREILKQFEQDAIDEQPQALRDLEAEMSELERLQPQVRAEVLRTETFVTGAQLEPFVPTTEWSRDVLGETGREDGSGVHWHGDDRLAPRDGDVLARASD